MSESWFNLCPNLADKSPHAYRLLCDCAAELEAAAGQSDNSRQLASEVRSRFQHLASDCPLDEQQLARAAIAIICDLKAQAWTFNSETGQLLARRPDEATASTCAEKDRVRAGLVLERDEQLRTSATRSFLRKMETRRIGPNGWTSIFSLMRDGEELAQSLRRVRHKVGIEQLDALRAIVDPYIQCVDDSRCEHTGLPLKEIWRYFRHTWVTPYQSVPGRNIWFLIRDRAVQNHPVIGIAALGSAIVQLTVRDNWIGWTKQDMLRRMREKPSEALARWVLDSTESLLSEIYIRDFLEQGVLLSDELDDPTDDTIEKLQTIANVSRQAHKRYPTQSTHKSSAREIHNWEQRACTHLFTCKRAEALSGLLKIKRKLSAIGFREPTVEALEKLLVDADGRSVVGELVRRVKSIHVGNDVMDIMVCGAVQPYNPILGGKLVSLLLTSPEVRNAYIARYQGTPSIIASSMAGRPIYRNPQLVLLGTTSLYGVGSSQYNRLRIPAEEIEGRQGEEIYYQQLGKTLGYGSYHFSKATLVELERLLAHFHEFRRVNSIFGEGVNPRLRKIRDALSLVGFDSERILRHGNSRIIYGVPLATNFRDFLVGLDKVPDPIFAAGCPAAATSAIADFWRRRWLSKRIEREAVLAEVESHTLVHPIRHGARVSIPEEPELPLFYG